MREDELLSGLGAYFEQQYQSKYEEIQSEMADVELPDALARSMKEAGKSYEREASLRRERQQIPVSRKRRMRMLSAACVFFLLIAAGTGIYLSPQTKNLRQQMHDLLFGSDPQTAAETIDRSGGSNPSDGDGEEPSGDKESLASEGKQNDNPEDDSQQDITDHGEFGGQMSDKKDKSSWSSPQNSTGDQPSGGRTEPSSDGSDSKWDENPSGSAGGNVRPEIPGQAEDPSDPFPGEAAENAAFPSSVHRVYYPSYLPVGYVRSNVSVNGETVITFKKESGGSMVFQYHMGAEYDIPSEKSEDVVVGSKSASLYQSGNRIVLIWRVDKCSMKIEAAAQDISREEMLRVAKSVSMRGASEVS